MRPKRVHVSVRNTAIKAVAGPARPWQLISASTVTAFALGCFVTVVAQPTTMQSVSSESRAPSALGAGVVDPALRPYLNPTLLKAVPVGPGRVSKPVQAVLTSPGLTAVLDANGIPEVALAAYQHAATVLAVGDPACHLPWQLLAAIGRVESDNGQFGGAQLLPNGNTTRPILGIPLDGQSGIALVRNPDGSFAQAEGPMQFLPSTWAEYGADGNGDGKKDVNNIFDAALGAADYLCAGGGNMTIPAQEAAAVLRYNDADDYVRVVLALAASYEHGDAAVVPAAGPVDTPSNSGASAAGAASSPHAEAPAPSKTPIPNATATPAPTPATQPATPASPAPTDTTETGPAPSDQPSPAPVPSAAPSFHVGQTADIGWAPAMRQVVVKLLARPKRAPAQPIRPTPTTAVPTVLTVCAAPANPASCATDMATRPAEMQVSGDGTAVVKNITWTDWGSTTARGTGTLYASNCNSSCAEGTYAEYSATITIAGITPYGQGTSAYSTVAVQAPGLPYNESFTDGLVP